MKKEALKIAEQIKQLVDQLVEISTAKTQGGKPSIQAKPKAKKGAAGGLEMLIEEGFFNSPKDFPAVIVRLQEIGRYYSKPTVAMNLLNLTKRRTLHRMKDNETKKWKYVIRR